jgi:ribonuclease Z
MAEIVFLGTRGSVAAADSDNTSFLLRAGGEEFLVDCSGNVVQKIKKLGVEPRCIRAVFLTHVHPDHIFGLPSLIHSLALEKGTLRLFGSAKTMLFSRRLLDLFRLREKTMGTRVEFQPLRPGHRARVTDALAVRTLAVPHHASSLAYHFDWLEEGKEIVYSGDTPPHPPLFEDARDVDILVHEASAPSRFFRKYPALRSMHTDSRTLGRRSEEAGVRCLVPCHFFGEVEFSLEEIKEEIRREFRGRLIMPREFRRIAI